MRWPYQQVFMTWLAENRGNFAYAPTAAVVTPGYVAFGLEGVSPLLRVKVFDCRVSVEVQDQGRRLSSLAAFEIEPATALAGVYYCTICGTDRLYPTLECLRREHLYAPLLRWIAEVLPTGKFIEIVQFKNGGTTARQFPYTYSTPAFHFDDFMDQLEMKYELLSASSYWSGEVAGFYYAPMFAEAPQLRRFISAA